MASTYKWSEAVRLVAMSIPGGKQVAEGSGPLLADLAQSQIWNAADWRGSLAELAPFYLVPGAQDHGAPTAAVPADFHGLKKVFLAYTGGAVPYIVQELSVVQHLDETYDRDVPNQISYESATGKFRVYPRVPDEVSATYFVVQGTYKKQPTKITVDNFQSAAIPWNDLYFPVALDALRYQYYVALGDPRQGSVQYAKDGYATYTGQLGVLMSGIWNMAQDEAYQLGDNNTHPKEALV